MIEDEKMYNIKQFSKIADESVSSLRNKITDGVIDINSDPGKKLKISGKNIKKYLKL